MNNIRYRLHLGLLCWLLMNLASTTFAQIATDSLITKIEVAPARGSEAVHAPAVAFDQRGNFIVAWQVEDQGRTNVLARRFDPIGRPLTGLLQPLASADTIAKSNPQLLHTREGTFWLAWEQSNSRQQTEAVAQIFDSDLKPLSNVILLHDRSDFSTTRPRLVADLEGRIVAAWVVESLPRLVVGRYFQSNGVAVSDTFRISESAETSAILDRLDLAASSAGLVAVVWHALEGNRESIYLRTFNGPAAFLGSSQPIAQNVVGSPSIAFVRPDELIAQWYASESGALIRGQRFDFSGQPLDQPFGISSGQPKFAPAIVAAQEQGSFSSFWSIPNPGNRRMSGVYGRAFDALGQPLTPEIELVMTPDTTDFGVDLETAFSAAGNFVLVYTGNDGLANSSFPRVGALLQQVALPDLQITSITLTPQRPTRADSIGVELAVLNAGAATAAASSALVQLTGAAEISRTVTVPQLLPEQAIALTINLGLVPPGSYFVEASADHPQEIPETDEQNNRATQQLTVIEAPALLVEPALLEFSATIGDTNRLAQTLTVQNVGSGELRWRVATEVPWLSVIPDSGSLTAQPQEVSVNVEISGLVVGIYQARLNFDSNGGRVSVNVILNVTPAVPNLSIDPHVLEFAATEGGLIPAPQIVTIRNSGLGRLNWSLFADQEWLFPFPTSGEATTETDTVSVFLTNLENLREGVYNGKVFIVAGDIVDSVAVQLTMSAKPPLLEVSDTSLSYTATEGVANPDPKKIAIHNLGGGTLTWALVDVTHWLSIRPLQGETRTEIDSVSVQASITGLTAGIYDTVFTVSSNGGVVRVRVHFQLNPRPRFPDLIVLPTFTGLDSCFGSDYGYLVSFMIQNRGEADIGTSVAQLLVNGQPRQQVNVPALQAGASFTLPYSTEPLAPGYNQIQCVVNAGPEGNESNTGNNAFTLWEWVPSRGDANLDSLLDLRDLSYVVDFILERRLTLNDRECWAANVFRDESINLADVVALIDLLLEGGTRGQAATAGNLELEVEKIGETRTRLEWSTSVPLRAWQAHWKLPQGTRSLPKQAMRQGQLETHWKIENDELKLLVWSSEVIAGGKYFLEIPAEIELQDLSPATGLSASGEVVELALQPREVQAEQPRSFALSPAYPNPMRRAVHHEVSWRYELPKSATVQMRLFNLLGQEIQHVALGLQPAGRGELRWNGRDRFGLEVAKGIYFLEFKAGDFVKRERLVIR